MTDSTIEVVETSDQSILVIEVGSNFTIDVSSETLLMSVDTSVEVISEGKQGPSGKNGASEDDVKYSKIVDFVSDSVFYKGEAIPGSTSVSNVWRVSRTTIASDGDVIEQWANGSAMFANCWNDRLTYNYS